MHVRRGDYVTDARARAYHGVLPLEYYRAAVACISARALSLRLFVFSDDPDWCRAHFRVGPPATFVDENHRDRSHEDLRLMSLCRHHIIANSAFGWWGAWLDPRRDKTVVAPRQWFGEPSLDTRDLIPESWIRL